MQKEDASMAAFYLISLALGVLIVSLRGSNVDLMHVSFGTVLALNNDALSLIGILTLVTLIALAIAWRALVAECLDPLFLRSVSRLGPPVHFIFLCLVVLNLVGGFQALGTLLSVGLMMLPAAAAPFWTTRVGPMCLLATGLGAVSCVAGVVALLSRVPAIWAGDHPVGWRDLSCFHPCRNTGRPRQPCPASYPQNRLNKRTDWMSEILKLATAVSLIALSPTAVATASAQELTVIASFSIIADLAENVGGDRVMITTLVGPGGDAHVYEPKPADAVAVAVAGADVVLVNGLEFERFLERLVEASETTAPIVELTSGVGSTTFLGIQPEG